MSLGLHCKEICLFLGFLILGPAGTSLAQCPTDYSPPRSVGLLPSTQLSLSRGPRREIGYYSGPYADIRSFIAAQMGGPASYVDACGNSTVMLPIGLPIAINSAWHNASSSVGYMGSLALFDERLTLARDNGLSKYYVTTYVGGMRDETFAFNASRSDDDHVDRIYSNMATGSYLNSQITAHGQQEIRITGIDGSIKIYQPRAQWLMDPNNQTSVYTDGAEMYFLKYDLGPVDPTTNHRTKITYDMHPKIDRIEKITYGNDDDSNITGTFTLGYSSDVPELSRLATVTETRMGDNNTVLTKTWTLAEQVSSGATSTPGYLGHISSTDGDVQFYYDAVGQIKKIANVSGLTGFPRNHIDFAYDGGDSKVTSLKGPYTWNGQPRELQFNYYVQSGNVVDMIDVLDSNRQSQFIVSGFAESGFTFQSTDPYGHQTTRSYSNQFDLIGFSDEKGFSYTKTIATVPKGGPYLSYVSSIKINNKVIMTRDLAANNFGALSFKDTFPLTGAGAYVDFDANGRRTCYSTFNAGQSSGNGCYASPLAGGWGKKWSCLVQGAYGCLTSVVESGGTLLGNTPSPKIVQTLTSHPLNPLLIQTAQVAVGSVTYPKVTMSYLPDGSLRTIEQPGIFKQIRAVFDWVGATQRQTFFNGTTTSMAEVLQRNADETLKNYITEAGDTHTFTYDPNSKAMDSYELKKNGLTSSMQWLRNNANVLQEEHYGFKSDSYAKFESQIKGYISAYPSQEPLANRLNHSCYPESCNVAQNGTYACNGSGGLVCQSLPQSLDPELEGPNTMPLMLWMTQSTTCPDKLSDLKLYIPSSNPGVPSQTITLAYASPEPGDTSLFWRSSKDANDNYYRMSCKAIGQYHSNDLSPLPGGWSITGANTTYAPYKVDLGLGKTITY